MNILSFNDSPSLKKTYTFYIVSFIFLLTFSIYLFLNSNFINDRWSNQSIVLTHIFTIGYLLPLVLGSLTQLLPVLFGIKISYRYFSYLVTIVPLSLFSYAISFHTFNTEKNVINLSILSSLWFLLSIFIFTLIRKSFSKYLEDRKEIYVLLLESIFNFFIALAISVYLMLIHYGFSFQNFRPHITNIHLQIMIIGFLAPLIVSILSIVIPMFYVTKITSKKLLFLSTFLTPLLYLKIFSMEFLNVEKLLIILISFILIIILTSFFYQILNRRRKSKDYSIYIWYFTFASGIATCVLWLYQTLILIENDYFDMIIGKVFFMGFILSITIVMLLKIIPFLCWLQLSNYQLEKNKFSVKIPHLGLLLDESDKLILTILLISNLSLQITQFNKISSITLFLISLIMLKIIIKNLMNYKKFMDLISL